MIKGKYNQHKETIHNFFWRGLQIFSKQGVTFLIFFMAASFLTPLDFGLLNYLMAILALLMIFCDFGLSTATSKYIAEYKAKESKNLNKILFSVSIVIISLATLVSLFIILFGNQIFKENYFYILYFLPYLFLVPLSSVADGVYRGLKEFKKLSIIGSIVGILSIAISYFLIKNYLLIGVIISQNILFLLLTICLFIFRTDFQFKIDKNVLKKIVKYSLVIGFTSIAYYMYNKIDILILNYFNYVVEIGYYEILNKIFLISMIPFVILGQIIAPNITQIYTNKKYKKVKQKFIMHLIFSLILGIILSICLYFLMPLIIQLFFNKYFTNETIYMFKILIFLLPIRIAAGVISQGHTIATGNAHYSLWTMIPAGFANMILDFIFIKNYGFIGVIYSTLICYSFATISFILLYYFELNRLIKRESDEIC